ncbi:transcriptional regulator [Asticcacaulis sp. BYS171W]|uniref:Transcriptional regulator n=1 Tax=Asticcacaulis aquaticus TaxID=2984212 RepID=A0ABT5HVT2_9CAUL|nr:transcriptional regulator [Asticcacaulis aquaticus]MDC7684192.1 transcriptional regulator [Asticcacaulis aquaticus]
MVSGSYHFDRFVLDARDRRLLRDGVAVEVSARYLDALILLVSEPGTLVSKDRFLDEVWQGVPVTDEALTQCIRSLRRVLDDDAGRPRFIETVVKHGYRFIAPVDTAAPVAAPVIALEQSSDYRPLLGQGLIGTLGASVAGGLGGLLYGFGAAAQSAQGASVLLVLLCLTTLIATLGGAGVSFGIAAGRSRGNHLWGSVLGGAAGGLVVGAVVKLLGLDAFTLLFGQSPGEITGAPEGLLLGAAVGLGAGLAERFTLKRGIALAALCGGLSGMGITLMGGRMMMGSLVLLAQHFPGSRLNFDGMWRLFGENGFGPVSQMVTAGLEGALFAGCIVGAMKLFQPRI